ncbi:MAG: GFA family protein [Rhodanobacter sp.]
MKTIELQCRCGEIGLEITGEPIAQIYCHCDDCRAAQGAAYVASSVYPAPSVRVVRGQPVSVIVKTTPRMRCATCGTLVFVDVISADMRSINAFLLPKGEFTPQLHVQCQHAVLPVVDNLPHYKGFPASFGGAEEFVAW